MADSTIEAIQGINASVGLNAPLVLPATVSSAMLPLALTMIGPMSAAKFPTTTYVTLILLDIVSGGKDPDPIFAAGNAFLKALRDAYKPLGRVDGFPIEKGLHPTANGGTGSPYGMTRLLKYGGNEFYGAQYHLTLCESN